jgi:TonB family protein
LDQPSIASKPVYVAARPQRRLIVEHNVVQLARAPVPASVAAPASRDQSKPSDLVSITVHPDRPVQSAQSKVPVWRRNPSGWRTVATTTTTSVTETAPQSLTHSAEFIQVAPSTTREVAPLGGETAINPQPPMIAYDEGAEGTTVFEVIVDERGTPTKCVITKSAGYPVLDDAVCEAAMRARYSPKMVDGRAVSGVYHDAFTFHMTDQNEQAIPSQVPSAVRTRGVYNETPVGANNQGPGGGG